MSWISFSQQYTGHLRPGTAEHRAKIAEASAAWAAQKRQANPSLGEEAAIVGESAGIGFGVIVGLAAGFAALCWVGSKIPAKHACGCKHTEVGGR